METAQDYNLLINPKIRKKLNKQRTRLKLSQTTDTNGKINLPYTYAVGLGERHFKSFDREIKRIEKEHPWLTKHYFRFIMNELIINTQFSMLREVVEKAPIGKKVPAYFYVRLYINEEFVAVNIEEFGDYFDYYAYIEKLNDKNREPAILDEQKEVVTDNPGLINEEKVKLVLRENDSIELWDQSNQIGLAVIEKATDHDFYITSFYKDNRYMWKRVYFRLENTHINPATPYFQASPTCE